MHYAGLTDEVLKEARAFGGLMSKLASAASLLVLCSGIVFAQTAQRPDAVRPLEHDATDDQIRQAVNRVRAGSKLTPKSWPGGARVAVGLTFDIDNELLARANPLPVPLSQGEYGATTALPRILAMLERHQVPATFFIPGVAAMLHPEMIPAIVKAGRHEIGVHGWIHENLPSIGRRISRGAFDDAGPSTT